MMGWQWQQLDHSHLARPYEIWGKGRLWTIEQETEVLEVRVSTCCLSATTLWWRNMLHHVSSSSKYTCDIVALLKS